MLKPKRLSSSRSIVALVLREMESTYGRSPGGYIWAVLEPVAAIALLSFVFALAFRTPSLGTSFPLFYASGYLPFTLYNDLNVKIARSIRFSQALLKYPRVTYMDAIIARFAVNFLTQIAVIYILLFLIIQTLSVQIILDVPSIILSLIMAAALSLGIGLVNCYLLPALPAWEQIWAILTRPLFIGSTILYTFEDVPSTYRDILWYNPLVHIVGAMRRGVYSTYDATYVSPVYVFGLSLTLIVIGLLLLRRFHRQILNNEM